MGQQCMKTVRRNPEDNQGEDISSRDFVYRAPFSDHPMELRVANETLLLKARLVLSYQKCNIQPKLSSRWPNDETLHHHHQYHHHHHHHPHRDLQKQYNHHHHQRCRRKHWKTKEDSGFLDADSDELMANESETNCCRLQTVEDDEDDGDGHQQSINCLSTCRDSTACHQPPHHRHRHHRCCCHDNRNRKQTKNYLPPLLTSDGLASISRRPKDCFERDFNRRHRNISTSSSIESPHETGLFKSKQLNKRPVIGRCHRELNKIFDVHGQLIRRDITQSKTELQKMIRESFISNKVKFCNSIMAGQIS